ncbi:MAG: hypothetical protein Q9220_002948 [cf. Caloplaca sp. 1 TL-2023]
MADDSSKSPEKKGGKAAGISTDEHFKFLIACIRWSNGGKVNFDEVAKECNIVTKAAAAKRYERLMKAHNIEKPSLSNPATNPSGTPAKKSATTNGTNSKKRKAETEASTNGNADDEEPAQAAKGKKKRANIMKSEEESNDDDKDVSKNGIKEEEEEEEGEQQAEA